MESFCDPTKNFITNKPYKQIVVGTSITEDEARKRCVEHTYKNRDHEGKDFFYQQHQNGHTICGFFDDKIDDSANKVKHGHAFGGICTIPEDVEIKLEIDEKVSLVSNDVKNNNQQISLVKTRNNDNTSEIESIKTRLNALEDLSEEMKTTSITILESIKALETSDETMLDSIKDLETSDETMLDSIKDLKSKDENLSSIISENLNKKCNMRKGWTGVGGRIVNFKKNGQNGIENGMTLGDCVRIGKQNGWNFVGHRNERHGNESYRNTCWRYDSNFKQNERLESWVRADGNDMVHTTVELKNNCRLGS